MAYTTYKEKNSVSIKLNNGTSSGVVQTVSVPFPRLSKTNIDLISDGSESGQKALNIAGLYEYCSAKEIYKVEGTSVVQMLGM